MIRFPLPRTPRGMRIDRDVLVPVRDGARLALSIYRPDTDEPVPVVMSMTPYGKDATPDRLDMTLMRLAGVRFGQLDYSPLTGFESPDPAFWVANGYAVVQGDVRGMRMSRVP